jgi:[methyl-Co(III) methanol-specific corrinoid protein]:coenzyme M methyltransferase
MKGLKMKPRDRFLAALRGDPVDRTPVVNVAALAPTALQERTGCWMPEVHLDPAKLVALAIANHDVLGFDGVSFIINFFNEPAALGARIDWGSPASLPMFASHPWEREEDAVLPLDFLSRPPLSTNLETLRLARELHGDRVGIIGKIMGPFSFVQVMHGLENTMLGLHDDPARVRRLLELSLEVLVPSARAQFLAGADAVLIGEGGAGAQMLSPALYERILRDVHAKLLAEIEGPTVLHICGDITPRLGALRSIGLDCFNFDGAIAPRVMKEAARGHFRIMGNVDTTDLLRGPPERIRAQVRACLEAEVDIVSPGCALSPACPLEHLLLLVETVLESSRSS